MMETQTTTTRPSLPTISTATETEIITYLRRSCKLDEIATLAEQDALVVKLCEHFGIEITDEEWQAAGDAFRLEHKLLGVQETEEWLNKQRTTIDDWSEGIRIQLLTKKLKEHLFGADVDLHYVSNREQYRRVALSQILVLDLTEALTIVRSLREENASFCALALEHSKGKQSQTNGGFVGIRFLAELMPEIVQAIEQASTGEIIGPIQTKMGYHILRIEKWFPTEMNESVREQIVQSLWLTWLKTRQQ